MATASAAQATLAISSAVARLKSTLPAAEQQAIQNTAGKDVLKSLQTLKSQIGINSSGLAPFVQGLQRYASAIEGLAPELAPCMPWLWAPFMTIFARTELRHIEASATVLDAYLGIVKTLPRIKRADTAFRSAPHLLLGVAFYVADILDFHQRIYRYVITEAELRLAHCISDSVAKWLHFDVRLPSVVKRMTRHGDAISRHVGIANLAEEMQWLHRLEAETTVSEQDKHQRQLLSIITALGDDYQPQESLREQLLRERHPGSSDWLYDHEMTKSWLRTDIMESPIPSIQGPPGSGKSVLCASLVGAAEESGSITLFYFCSPDETENWERIWKTLLVQLVSRSSEVAATVYESYIDSQTPYYIETAVDDLGRLCGGSGTACRIIVDGLDQCAPQDQRLILAGLIHILGNRLSSEHNIKVLISTRDTSDACESMKRYKFIIEEVSLLSPGVRESANNTIMALVDGWLRLAAVKHPSMSRVAIADRDGLKQLIADRSGGVLLWARVFLDNFSGLSTICAIQGAAKTMPQELHELYQRIIYSLVGQKPFSDRRAYLTSVFLCWLALAKRPMMKHEILHGVMLILRVAATARDLLEPSLDSAIKSCRAFVKRLPGGSMTLVHPTAQEPLLQALRTDGSSISRNWRFLISNACLTVLRDSLSLLDPHTSQEYQLTSVVNGSHDLLPYALDFWYNHLFEMPRVDEISPDSPFALMTAEFAKEVSSLPAEIVGTVPSWMQVLVQRFQHLPSAGFFVRVVAFNFSCVDVNHLKGQEFEDWSMENDPTRLSKLSVEFRNMIGQLLDSSQQQSGVPAQFLEQLKRRYSPCAYRCRFRGCHAGAGFPSPTERATHEDSHVRRWYCGRVSCSKERDGLQAYDDLAKHSRTFHHDDKSYKTPARTEKWQNLVLPRSNDPAKRLNETNRLYRGRHGLPHFKMRLPIAGVMSTEKVLGVVFMTMKTNYNWGVIVDAEVKQQLDVDSHLLIPHKNPVLSLCFSPDDKLIAIGSFNGTVCIFDAESGETLHCQNFNVGEVVREYKRDIIETICFSPDGKLVAFAVNQAVLRVWDYEKEIVWIGNGEGDIEVGGVAFLPNGKAMITLGRDRRVRTWAFNEPPGPNARLFPMSVCLPEDVNSPVAIAVGPQSIAVSPDSRFMALGLEDGIVDIWKIGMVTGAAREGPQRVMRLPGYTRGHNPIKVTHVAFSPDGLLLARRWERDSVQVFRTEFFDKLPVREDEREDAIISNILWKMTMRLHRGPMSGITFTPDSRWVIVTGLDQTTVILDVETGQPNLIATCPEVTCAALAGGHSRRIYATAISSIGAQSSEAWASEVRIWSHREVSR
ncbi:hypothetical protein B0H63DRAFT_488235 [Podospora didyma]|uniref:Nephrocystin 3-like N-terminal domain-containing protein n=1 Tax=Podospora didyma TaxID=330526 RepID=A0AAE0N3R2_9PEZI|nr:hypothetical protein B0H63DRAFT_488235 [Podospora didyma]